MMSFDTAHSLFFLEEQKKKKEKRERTFLLIDR
jgi:hypothetical protein